MDLDLVKTELAMYGILYENGQCTVIEGGTRKQLSVLEEVTSLRQSVAENTSLFRQLWRELASALSATPLAVTGGSEQTGRMFVECLKHLFRITFQFKRPERRLVKALLCRDINSFPESYMSRVVDLNIGLDWLHHLMEADRHRLKLLRAVMKPNEKVAIQGPWGNLDLPMEERLWSYDDEGENLEDHDKEKQNQQRYQLPDTYNDPYNFEEGFYYREMRNEPYAWDDEENNPYPHRDLLWGD